MLRGNGRTMRIVGLVLMVAGVLTALLGLRAYVAISTRMAAIRCPGDPECIDLGILMPPTYMLRYVYVGLVVAGAGCLMVWRSRGAARREAAWSRHVTS